jgi:hypothetical protein
VFLFFRFFRFQFFFSFLFFQLSSAASRDHYSMNETSTPPFHPQSVQKERIHGKL